MSPFSGSKMILPHPLLIAYSGMGEVKQNPSLDPRSSEASMVSAVTSGWIVMSRSGFMPRARNTARTMSSVPEPGVVMPIRSPFMRCTFSSVDMLSMMPFLAIASFESRMDIGRMLYPAHTAMMLPPRRAACTTSCRPSGATSALPPMIEAT